MLGIKVYPAEDLKSRRIVCRLNPRQEAGGVEQTDFTKVILGQAGIYRSPYSGAWPPRRRR
jgi:hypothetical protein